MSGGLETFRFGASGQRELAILLRSGESFVSPRTLLNEPTVRQSFVAQSFRHHHRRSDRLWRGDSNSAFLCRFVRGQRNGIGPRVHLPRRGPISICSGVGAHLRSLGTPPGHVGHDRGNLGGSCPAGCRRFLVLAFRCAIIGWSFRRQHQCGDGLHHRCHGRGRTHQVHGFVGRELRGGFYPRTGDRRGIGAVRLSRADVLRRSAGSDQLRRRLGSIAGAQTGGAGPGPSSTFSVARRPTGATPLFGLFLPCS